VPSSTNQKNPRDVLRRRNLRLARAKWGKNLSPDTEQCLAVYFDRFGLLIECGDLLLLDRRWYITHAGLLRLATRKRCCGIQVAAVPELCAPGSQRWAFKATVFKSPSCKGFVGYGDADPTNVSPLVHGAELRMAETRAVNRALRKAYGIGICSVEELGRLSDPLAPSGCQKRPARQAEPANSNGNHPLRDRLCLLIRQHQLDPALVKAYAADYCDVSELRQASREQVGTFIKHLAGYAQNDRHGLLCQLNSYAPKSVCAAPAATQRETDAEQEKAAGAA
jgi:hypothetical protein